MKNNAWKSKKKRHYCTAAKERRWHSQMDYNETFSTPHPGQASPGYQMAWRGDHSMSGSDEDG